MSDSQSLMYPRTPQLGFWLAVTPANSLSPVQRVPTTPLLSAILGQGDCSPLSVPAPFLSPNLALVPGTPANTVRSHIMAIRHYNTPVVPNSPLVRRIAVMRTPIEQQFIWRFGVHTPASAVQRMKDTGIGDQCVPDSIVTVASVDPEGGDEGNIKTLSYGQKKVQKLPIMVKRNLETALSQQNSKETALDCILTVDESDSDEDN